jgi:hypothetical protein
MSEQPWRVGNHQARNIYRGDSYVAVVVGDDALAGVRAREIVAILNRAEAPVVDHDTWADGIPVTWGQP